MNYCGIKRIAHTLRSADTRNFFNPNNEPYQSLGDKIIESLNYGSDIGSPAIVQFDSKDTDDVDVLTDPNHDFFDIAEQYQEQLSANTPVVPLTSENE